MHLAYKIFSCCYVFNKIDYQEISAYAQFKIILFLGV